MLWYQGNWTQDLGCEFWPSFDEWLQKGCPSVAVLPKRAPCVIKVMFQNNCRSVIKRVRDGGLRMYPFEPMLIEWQ
jgi:hypothetical protein